MNDTDDYNFSFNLDNDYEQQLIYTEWRRNNSEIETWHHVLGISGCLVSIIGIIGNLLSIIALLQSYDLSFIRCFKRKPQTSKKFNTLDQQFQTIYSYLIGLAVCDLFSCIFAILSVLEYIPSLTLETYPIKYRKFCLYISIYTQPIATTLQALSVWLICAFSIHRCRFISVSFRKKNNKFVSKLHIFKKIKQYCCCSTSDEQQSNNKRQRIKKYCIINLNTIFSKKPYIIQIFLVKLKFFLCTLSCFTCKQTSEQPNDFGFFQQNNLDQNEQQVQIHIHHGKPSQIIKTIKREKKVRDTRIIICILYLVAFMYLLPQLFEKTLIKLVIDEKVYLFTSLTEFGTSRHFRHLYHLWLYLFAVCVIPFILILTSNYFLLQAFLRSKKRCKRYKINNFEHILLTPYHLRQSITLTLNTDNTNDANASLDRPSQKNRKKIRRFYLKRGSERAVWLTITLFSAVLLFLICHLPSLITRIMYICYPEMEFQPKSKLTRISFDIANFLIMLNSSINFIPYILFGPRKFRQQFSHICMSLINRICKHCSCLKSFVCDSRSRFF